MWMYMGGNIKEKDPKEPRRFLWALFNSHRMESSLKACKINNAWNFGSWSRALLRSMSSGMWHRIVWYHYTFWTISHSPRERTFLEVPCTRNIFLTILATISFWRRTLLRTFGQRGTNPGRPLVVATGDYSLYRGDYSLYRGEYSFVPSRLHFYRGDYSL